MENDIRGSTNPTQIGFTDELTILQFVFADRRSCRLCCLDWFRLPTMRFLLCS